MTLCCDYICLAWLCRSTATEANECRRTGAQTREAGTDHGNHRTGRLPSSRAATSKGYEPGKNFSFRPLRTQKPHPESLLALLLICFRDPARRPRNASGIRVRIAASPSWRASTSLVRIPDRQPCVCAHNHLRAPVTVRKQALSPNQLRARRSATRRGAKT